METETKTALINVAEMIDLSIGMPKQCTVDFVMLHAVLHCLAQQLGCSEKMVEVRGQLAEFPVGRQTDDAATVVVNEFLVETDGQPAGPADDKNLLLVAERIPKTEKIPTAAITVSKMGVMPGAGPGRTLVKNVVTKPGDGKKTITIGIEDGKTGRGADDKEAGTDAAQEPGGRATMAPGEAAGGELGPAEGAAADATGTTEGVPDGGIGQTPSAQRLAESSRERLSLVSLNKFNQLQKSVDDLKSKVYGAMPNNGELLEGVRSQTNMKGITDMWASLNVSSRLEAAEAGIAKLSSLMEDLIGKDAFMQKEGETGATSQVQLSESGNIIRTSMTGMQQDGQDEYSQLLSYLQSLQNDFNHLSGEFYRAMKEMGQEVEPPPGPEAPPVPGEQPQDDGEQPAGTEAPAPGGPPSDSPGVTPATTVTPPHTQDTSPVDTEPATPAPTPPSTPLGRPPKVKLPAKIRPASGDINVKINVINGKLKDLERRVNQMTPIVFTSDGNILQQVQALQEVLERNGRQAFGMTPCGADAATITTPGLQKDSEGMTALNKVVNDIQAQLKQIALEKEERRRVIDSLLEQIEILKAIKLDREDMTVALADKADLKTLERKVSHDRFDSACNDLAKGLEHALGKMTMQDSLWQQALDDIQREIESKLDRVELAPIRDFFLNKMKQLQDSLKEVADLRREAEAAGTKSKLLKDVNCVSCDARAFMKTEAGAAMPPKPLQPGMSMRPYLTYELDKIRKSQATNVGHRSVHGGEKLDKQMTTPRPVQKTKSDTNKHLCNRYCGGSHTTTTAAQRVARSGHYVKQWGPDVIPLASSFATGDDGRIYKVSGVEHASVGPGGAVDKPCTPRPPVKRQQSKPNLTPDCRCIEDVLPPRK